MSDQKRKLPPPPMPTEAPGYILIGGLPERKTIVVSKLQFYLLASLVIVIGLLMLMKVLGAI